MIQSGDEILVNKLRHTPAFLADETPEALCEHASPAGLFDSAAKLAWLLNASDVTETATSREAKGSVTVQLHGNLSSCVGSACARRSLAAHDSRLQEQRVLCLQLARRLQRATARAPRRYASCAVVGSGGTLKRARLRKLIDSYDAVFRHNLAPVAGAHGRDVGTRTTFRVLSHFPWRVVLSGWAPSMLVGPTLYCFNAWLGVCQLEALVPSTRPSKAARQHMRPIPMVNPTLVGLAEALQLRHTTGRVRSEAARVTPSSGLVGVALAMALCERVSVLGFGNATDRGSAGRCWHYFDCRRNQTAYLSRLPKSGWRSHDCSSQWRVLERLFALGAARSLCWCCVAICVFVVIALHVGLRR